MSVDDMVKQWEENYKKMEEVDFEARREGQLIGRYLREQIADGYAYYQITKENKNTVVIEHVTGIGDDYSVPYWGSKASIKKAFAIQNVECRDKFNALFSKKKES